MIFDVKMEYLRRNVGMVAWVHMTYTPSTITYDGVVFCETVRVALKMAALHDLIVITAYIINAYIKTTCG